IQGLYVENIDVLDAVKRLGAALNMEVANQMIDSCHLVREKAGASGPPAMILKFVRRFNAEAMLTKRK
ncbi:hypothetical protein J6590_096683, partial [Homalodisca vitripennis]